MGISKNLTGTKISNHLLRHNFIKIAKAITIKLFLASNLLFLFFERNEFLELTCDSKSLF